MTRYKTAVALLTVGCVLALAGGMVYSQAQAKTVQVHLVITDQKLNDE